MAAVVRSRAICATRDFLKALVAPDNDRVLGITVFRGSAGEIMSATQMNFLINIMTKLGLLKKDLDYHLISHIDGNHLFVLWLSEVVRL